MNEQNRMMPVGSMEYLPIYRWRKDDLRTRFAVHMSILSIPVWLLSAILQGAQTATMLWGLWIVMTLVAATFYTTLSHAITEAKK